MEKLKIHFFGCYLLNFHINRRSRNFIDCQFDEDEYLIAIL